jgi:hypothetical protein
MTRSTRQQKRKTKEPDSEDELEWDIDDQVHDCARQRIESPIPQSLPSTNLLGEFDNDYFEAMMSPAAPTKASGSVPLRVAAAAPPARAAMSASSSTAAPAPAPVREFQARSANSSSSPGPSYASEANALLSPSQLAAQALFSSMPTGFGSPSNSLMSPLSGGGKKARFTNLDLHDFYDVDVGTHFALTAKNAFDRAKFMNGTLGWDASEEEDKKIIMPMKIIYPRARAARFLQVQCTTPAAFNHQYPVYVTVGLDPDPDTTLANSEKMHETIAQIMSHVNGSHDASNNATFQVTIHRVAVDANTMRALIALK